MGATSSKVLHAEQDSLLFRLPLMSLQPLDHGGACRYCNRASKPTQTSNRAEHQTLQHPSSSNILTSRWPRHARISSFGIPKPPLRLRQLTFWARPLPEREGESQVRLASITTE